MKRGQITFFVIIGFLILFVMGLFVYIKLQPVVQSTQFSVQKTAGAEQDIIIFVTNLQSTLDKATSQGFHNWRLQGGSDSVPHKTYPGPGGRTIAFLVFEGQNYFDHTHSLTELQDMISQEFLSLINPRVYEQGGYAVELRSIPEANLTVGDESSVVLINPQLTITTESKSHDLSHVTSDISFDFTSALDEIDSLVQTIEQQTGPVDLNTYAILDTQTVQRICAVQDPEGDYFIKMYFTESYDGYGPPDHPLTFDFISDKEVMGCTASS